MKTSRKPAKRPAKNMTSHKRALTSKVVTDRIKKLRKGWKTMNGIARGDGLHALVKMGCSTRGLAKSLHQSQTTIRRQLQLAALPAAQRKAVNAGDSAKKILETKAAEVRRFRIVNQLAEEQRSGALSDELADMILRFCRAEDGLPPVRITQQELPIFLGGVETKLGEYEARGRRGIRATKRMGVEGLFRKTQPLEDTDDFWMAYQSEWLANIIQAKVPIRLIWENGMKKTKERAADLLVEDNRTPLQVYFDNAVRLVELGSGGNNRPYYPGGARRMPRQGRKAIS